jgi:glycolate oxidase iron-sulfur subunit
LTHLPRVWPFKESRAVADPRRIIYNLTEPVMAARLLERTVRHLEATGAAAVVTANPGCIQIAAGVRRRELPMRVLHIGELLDGTYAVAERGA